MVSIPFLAVGIFMKLVAVLFAFSCIALILIILVQKGRGGGLSSAFGGGGAGGVVQGLYGEDAERILYVDVETVERPGRGTDCSRIAQS